MAVDPHIFIRLFLLVLFLFGVDTGRWWWFTSTCSCAVLFFFVLSRDSACH